MNVIKKTTSYFSEVFDEMKKVTWPSKNATTRYTVIVVAFALALGLFFTVLDFIFNWGLEKLLVI